MRGMLHCFVAAIPPSPRPTTRLVDQERHTPARHSPTTIIVKCAPRLATILCLCNPDTRVQLRGAWQETTTGKAHLVGEVGNADTVGEGSSSGHGGRRATEREDNEGRGRGTRDATTENDQNAGEATAALFASVCPGYRAGASMHPRRLRFLFRLRASTSRPACVRASVPLHWSMASS